jgi:hypothetical protein
VGRQLSGRPNFSDPFFGASELTCDLIPRISATPLLFFLSGRITREALSYSLTPTTGTNPPLEAYAIKQRSPRTASPRNYTKQLHQPHHVPPPRHRPLQSLRHNTLPEVSPARALQLRMQSTRPRPALQVAPVAHPAAAQPAPRARAHDRGAQRPGAQKGRCRRHTCEEGE